MKQKRLLALSLIITLLSVLSLPAQSRQEAEQLMSAGRYAEAKTMLDGLISATKANNTGELNLLAGECALKLNDAIGADNYFSKAAQRGVADAYMQLGRNAMLRYDFAKAAEHYNKYVYLREKVDKDASAGRAAAETAATARDMLDRVERLVFIDSIEVPVNLIHQAIILAPEAGIIFADDDGRQGFASSDRRLRYTTKSSADSTFICEQTLLLSGDYDAPMPIMEGADARFPFMMPDGCTFYFSSTRPGGLGGLDLYRSNRDSEDGTFLGAVNMGMPYNSPANDYFLAIDEYTGVGWLATDRNHPDGNTATVYTFIPNEVRENYNTDTPGLVSLARISSIAATQNPDSDYSALLDKLDEMAEEKPASTPEYSFTMPDGRVITEFRDNATRMAVRQYLTDRTSLDNLLTRLEALRGKYASVPSQTLADEILKGEREAETLRRSVRNQMQALILKLTD